MCDYGMGATVWKNKDQNMTRMRVNLDQDEKYYGKPTQSKICTQYLYGKIPKKRKTLNHFRINGSGKKHHLWKIQFQI